jgi:hypothetical protein
MIIHLDGFLVGVKERLLLVVLSKVIPIRDQATKG